MKNMTCGTDLQIRCLFNKYRMLVEGDNPVVKHPNAVTAAHRRTMSKAVLRQKPQTADRTGVDEEHYFVVIDKSGAQLVGVYTCDDRTVGEAIERARSKGTPYGVVEIRSTSYDKSLSMPNEYEVTLYLLVGA